MNEDQQTLLLIKGTIFELPLERRQAVALAAAQINSVIAHDREAGIMAVVLVSAQLQLEG